MGKAKGPELMWTGLASVLSPLVAVVIFVITLRRTSHSDRIRILFEMQERYTSEACRTGRRAIHQHVSGRAPEEIASLREETVKQVGAALAIMNTIAICVQAGYCDKRLMYRSMGRSYVSTLRAAQPFLDRGAQIRGYRAYGHAEELARHLDVSFGNGGQAT